MRAIKGSKRNSTPSTAILKPGPKSAAQTAIPSNQMKNFILAKEPVTGELATASPAALNTQKRAEFKMILLGDCLEKLKELDDNSVDSVVTDPPAGISFMSKNWDSDKGGRMKWVSWLAEIMRECNRVLKPGGHTLVWAIPRTSHWTATAVEDAGFEVRDVITHHFGSGFPKSLDISKAIDKAAGALGSRGQGFNVAGQNVQLNQNKELRSDHPNYVEPKPITDAAKQWQGFGTALKPASEHWILARKPISEKTVAANVLKWGVGGLNVDVSRTKTNEDLGRVNNDDKGIFGVGVGVGANAFAGVPIDQQGRWPANLILSCHCETETHEPDCPVRLLDEQSGVSPSNKRKSKGNIESAKTRNQIFPVGGTGNAPNDSGGASRFFYCAKASKRERGLGNNHPTVKSLKLMEYLIKLITPPGGTVLDCFMGSGSTGVAAFKSGFKFIGIEQSAEYCEIAKKRIENASA